MSALHTVRIEKSDESYACNEDEKQVPLSIFKATLVELGDITHDIKEFRFKGDAPAKFLAGQYAVLNLPGVKGLRAYSMANTPNDDYEWNFMVKKVRDGQGSNYLFPDKFKPGTEVSAEGPLGTAYLQNKERDIVCIAGGSGLAPMLSVIRDLNLRGQD